MDIFFARQPIFDRRQGVFGYELLFRGGPANYYPVADGDKATLEVIRNSLLIVGADKVTGGRRAFFNFTRTLLLNRTAFFLPKELAVLEIMEDVTPDQEVVEACLKLKESGYLLALDDYIWPEHEQNPLAEIVDIIKVDFLRNGCADRKRIREKFTDRPVKLLAEKVETRRDFQEALEMGFTYFQGYFFSEPVIIFRRDLPGHRLAYLGLMRELSRKNLDFNKLQIVIERDTSVSYKLLKYLNSAFFGLRHEITSIRHGLQLLGEEEIRKWAALVTLMELCKGQPPELLRLSLLRARFCEALAAKGGLGAHKAELFLLGMFSLMDVLIGRPLAEIMEEMPLSDKVKNALLGQKNLYRQIFDLGLSYEQGNWGQVAALASQVGVPEEEMPGIYAEAILWVESPYWF